MNEYEHRKIESKWQDIWGKNKQNEVDENSTKPKYYSLIEFPYPSGDGLHVGHPRPYIAMDIISRKRRREGYNVLYPIGWDAFGLPAENYAVKTGTPPKEIVKKNAARFKKQIQSLGISFDWSREINTTNPKYYKWTQWIFLQLFKHGLAYKQKTLINWCKNCKIGLANEEVVGGACERCGGKVEKREKEQWMLAITKYADRLLNDLEKVDYIEPVKIQQRNWIGKSSGAEISFPLRYSQTGADKTPISADVKVFTTRPDTLFGATYMVLSPEHELINELESRIKNLDEVKRYINEAGEKTDIERTAEGKEKTGVEVEGIKAVNPANQEEIPVWVADYVLAHYGTGAIMAVPAHDERDWDFAKKFNLPVKTVIEPVTGEEKPNEEFRKSIVAIVENSENGKLLSINWGSKLGGSLFVGGGIEEEENPEDTARREVLEETGYADLKLISKFEKVHHHYFAHSKNIPRHIEAIGFYFKLNSDKQDKITLEEDEKGKFKIEWISKDDAVKNVKDSLHRCILERLVFGKVYTDNGLLVNSGQFTGIKSEEAKKKITELVSGVMKTTYKLRDWVFSRQRYWGEPIPVILCPKCGPIPLEEKDLPLELPEIEDFMPRDDGESPLAKAENWVNVKCPRCGSQAKRETDTMPTWAGSSWYFLRYVDPENDKVLADKKKLEKWMPVDWYNGGMEHTTLHLLYSRFWYKFLFDIGVVPNDEPYKKRTSHGLIIGEDNEKMSKSRGNVVNPDDIVEKFGADTMRVYEMFMGPFDQAIAWSTDGLMGPRRFLEKLWRAGEKLADVPGNEPLRHETIMKVSSDIEGMRFNTAISSMMSYLNEFGGGHKRIPREDYRTLLQLLAPFAPHITEELWQKLGEKDSIHLTPWPAYDKNKLAKNRHLIVVTVNGKVRGEFEVGESDEEFIKKEALNQERVKEYTEGKDIKKIIYVKNKLVNIVV